MLAQIPVCGAELGGTALLLPLPWVQELKAKMQNSYKLKMHQLGKAAWRLGKGSARSGCLQVLLWGAKVALPGPLDSVPGEQGLPYP